MYQVLAKRFIDTISFYPRVDPFNVRVPKPLVLDLPPFSVYTRFLGDFILYYAFTYHLHASGS